MKSEFDTEKSCKARLKKTFKAAEELLQFRQVPWGAFEGDNVADMRALVEDITQCFHEFNAYWNVYSGDDGDPTF